MLVEPTNKNFQKFKKENPFLHLNVYMVVTDEEKAPVKPLHELKLLYKDDQHPLPQKWWRTESLCLHQEHEPVTSQCHKAITQSICVFPYCACTYFNTQENVSGPLGEKHTYIDNEFVCEKYLNTLHTEEAMQIHKMICMVKECELQLVEYLLWLTYPLGRM